MRDLEILVSARTAYLDLEGSNKIVKHRTVVTRELDL